ncbi:NAD(P)-binding protein [Phlegmacium glaucopus]|nr:NAD(P)-binding protein [Phlegmacium glaucopus]
MPSVSKGSKVLVSGANGYIAMWVVRTLLERGYTVRGTARTEDKGKFMIDYFKSLGYGDKFEVVVVDDITKEGAFDEAVKGVDAIEHTASPFPQDIKEPEDVIKPAVQGTLGMLKSALKHGSQVQRIVITSSCASVIRFPPSEPTVFSERDWNETAIKEVQEKGAWEFHEQHKSQIQWDLAVINPPYVFGTWYDMVVADSPKTKEALSQSTSWVDVRDTALAHVLALEKDAAGGQRIITTSVDVANSLSPSPLPSRTFRPGFPEITTQGDSEPVYMTTYDKSKEASILGIKFRTKLETTKDTLEDFARRGW